MADNQAREHHGFRINDWEQAKFEAIRAIVAQARAVILQRFRIPTSPDA